MKRQQRIRKLEAYALHALLSGIVSLVEYDLDSGIRCVWWL